MTAPTMRKFARFKQTLIFLSRAKTRAFFFIFPCCFSAFAQSDSIQTVITLPEATVAEMRLHRTGYAVWSADSLPVGGILTLSNRLFWENGLDLRQNAPGTLATVSARGAGPNRTAVFWNGLNLQSPMNGVVDASLVSLWPGDQLEVRQGGNSATQSGGAMGGSIVVESAPWGDQMGLSGNIGLETGSYDRISGQGAMAYNSPSFSSRLAACWQAVENDFSFPLKGLDGRIYRTRQPNNFAEKSAVQQFNRWRINPNNVVKTAAWFQRAFRQIPPAITESASNTWQRDWSGRGVATWEHSSTRQSRLQTRLGWQDEFIAFHFAGATEESRAQTLLVSTDWYKKNQQGTAWFLGGSAQGTRAQSDGYRIAGSWYRQTRLAGFALGEQSFGRGGKASLSIRQEWASGQAAPFTWTVGWEIPAASFGFVRGHVSRNFNLPTFNDRFWETLKDTTLMPEKGYSADLGWRLKKNRLVAEITGFQLILDDWILWQPGSDGIFRPGNLRKVRSRGVEANLSQEFRFCGIAIKGKARMQWSQTENVAVYDRNPGLLGKQLPYTPALSGGGGIWMTHKAWAAVYLHQYTGKRYSTSDNQYALPGFQTGTFMLQYELSSIRFWKWTKSMRLGITVDNIWDATYQSLANRPMPGRNWRVSLAAAW